jgi:hypothetical protein
MNEEKFKLSLSTPIDKNGVTIKLALSVEDSQALSLKHYPEFIWYLFAIIGVFGGLLISLLVGSIFWVYCALFLVYLLYNVFYARAFICVIDKKTSSIEYHRSGVLMTSFDEQKDRYSISEIKRLEMQRYVRGGRWAWADKFQIFLLLDKNRRVPLSPSNLDFSECQGFTEQIRNFIGNEVPIKALD